MKTVENKNRSSESEFVVLEGVAWETYEGILDALGKYHLRHTYDDWALEMRRVLFGVAWEDYLKLLDATPDLYLRHTYDEGTLEMMSAPSTHYYVAKLVARIIEAYAFASDKPIQSVGSMTLQASKGGCGLQPDETYYLAHEPLVRCKDTYDPKRDPPPDLAIEIDVTNTCLPRMPVFAKIHVPEIWRLDERRRLGFYRLTKAKYEEIEHSIAFAFLKLADLMRFVNRRSEIGENAVVREFVEWATRAQAKVRKGSK